MDRSRRTLDERPLEKRFPGVVAWLPTDIPRSGWGQILKRAWDETRLDQIPLLAAGVAFWAFISLFPALIAAITIYGLIADPDTVTRQAEAIGRALPGDATSVVVRQMQEIANQANSNLGFGLLASLALALWTASAATSHLISAVNVAYDEGNRRSFLRRRGLALVMTMGAITFVVLAVGLIAVIPVVLDVVVPSDEARLMLHVARWLGLIVSILAALAVLYHVAPHRSSARFSWVSVGSVAATLVWILASIGFSVYVDNFGRYSKTYGALAGVAVLMLWFWITALIVLVGAEINAEAEQQTLRDTTTGKPKPLGQRGAVKADTRPDARDDERKPV